MRHILSALAAAVAAGLVTAVAPAYGQSRGGQNRPAADGDTTDRRLTINISSATPQGGATVQLTSDYSISIYGDTVVSQLPFYGRAYTVPYGGGDGLMFKAPISGYTSSRGKDGATNITFKTKTAEDSYDFSIRVYDNGKAYVSVQPQQRSHISYQGTTDTER